MIGFNLQKNGSRIIFIAMLKPPNTPAVRVAVATVCNVHPKSGTAAVTLIRALRRGQRARFYAHFLSFKFSLLPGRIHATHQPSSPLPGRSRRGADAIPRRKRAGHTLYRVLRERKPLGS